MFRSVLKFALIAALAVAAAACTTVGGGAPDAAGVTAIQNACAVDAGIRPTVTALLAVPGLATVDEVAAVTAARAVIDPVCANPSGTFQANTVAAVAGASGQIVGVLTALETRKAKAPAAAVAPAKPASA